MWNCVRGDVCLAARTNTERFTYGAFGASPYPPSGGGSVTNDHSDQHSELHQKTTINVFAGDNEEIGSTIARHQSSVNANLIRDMSGKAVG